MSHSPNTRWHVAHLTRDERWSALGSRGATVWLTGLSGAGKSTIGTALEHDLVELGSPAYMLDGDNLRLGLNNNLGFSAEDRAENVRRVGEVARLFADAGMISIVTLISPYRTGRDYARRIHHEAGLPFFEVWVATSLDECERRDTKGLYARARAGEITDLTGVGSPYEPPERAEIKIVTEVQTVKMAVSTITSVLRERA